MFKSFVLFLFCVFLSFAEDDSTITADIEPPTGNKQFYTGLGLITGGVAFNLIGIWILSSFNTEEVDYGPKDIYGVPYDSTVYSYKFAPVLGWGCIITGIGLDVIGLPILVRGRRQKNIRNEWEERTKISFYINPFYGTYSLRSTISF